MLKIQKNDKWLATVRDDYQVGVFAYTRSGKVVLVTSRKENHGYYRKEIVRKNDLIVYRQKEKLLKKQVYKGL